MEKQKKDLNDFFVRVFNQILSWEEQSFKTMGIEGISLREMHIIEAVCVLRDSGRNRMSEIAGYLAITPGSLTTSVNCLVKKGYLKRKNDERDRRVVFIIPEKRAEAVNAIHKELHKKMIDSITEDLCQEDIVAVLKALRGVSDFFSAREKVRRG